MHRLEMPDAFARLDVERHERVGKQVVARPPAAVPCRRRRRQRDVHVSELFVGGHGIPRPEIPGQFPGVVAPGLVAELAWLRHDVKRPEPFAGDHVVAAHVFRCGLFAVAAIAGAGRVPAHHDDVADHDRPGAVVEAPGQRLAIGEAQAHTSLLAEPLRRTAGLRIGGVEILATNGQDPLVGIVSAATPVIDPARRRTRGFFSSRSKGLLLPNRRAGFTVERDHEPVCVLRVEHAVDRDRRRTGDTRSVADPGTRPSASRSPPVAARQCAGC